jgi:ketosteroid isomerase-like protein
VSRENVELVRRGYELLNSGRVEDAFALYDPNIEVHLAKDPDGMVGPGTRRPGIETTPSKRSD